MNVFLIFHEMYYNYEDGQHVLYTKNGHIVRFSC
ncbi:hypothetical protein J2W97_000380 [Paenibacillus jamilae]|nr:hypothetical protein [Paenibacillus jamilae]